MNELVSGIWQIDEAALLSLEKIIDEECAEIVEKRNKQLDVATKKARDEARKRGEYQNLSRDQTNEMHKSIRDRVKAEREFNLTNERQFTITLAGGGQKSSPSLKPFLNDGSLDNETIVRLEANVLCCGVKCQVELPYSGKLKHSAETEYIGIAAHSFYAVEKDGDQLLGHLLKWANERKFRGFFEFWAFFSLFPWFLFFFIFLVLFVSLRAPNVDIKQQAHAIVAEGVNNKNRDKAIEVMLRLMTDTSQKDHPGMAHVPTWLWTSAGFGILLCLVLSFPPRCIIGIGKGKGRIANRARFYANARWIILTLIVLPVIGGIVGGTLKDFIIGYFQ